MKKIIFMSLIICLVSFGTAYAESEMAAYILKDYDCVIPAAQSGFPYDLHSIDMIDLSTTGGVTKLVCRFIIPEGYAPAKTTIMRGFDCPIYSPECGETMAQDSIIFLMPGGQIVVVCSSKQKAGCP